jgi:hypothetical protein
MDYSKLIMGENAIHIPFNFVRQTIDSTHGLILGQETGNKLSFGSKMCHVFVKGDMIFRPQLVIESNMLVGMGAAGIITSSVFADIAEGDKSENNILLDLR